VAAKATQTAIDASFDLVTNLFRGAANSTQNVIEATSD
jgi:hypothetical protein